MTIHDAPPADGARDGEPEVSVASAAAAAGVAGEARPGGEPSGGPDLFGLDDGIDDVAPRPRRRRSKLTTALAAVALVGAGVIAGVAADQHWGPDASATTPRVAGFGGFGARGTGGQATAGQGGAGQTGAAAGAGAATGAQGGGSGQAGQGAQGGQAAQGGQGQGTGRGNGGGFGGFGGRAGAAAVGRVARIEGSTLVVTANDGSEVRVDTKGATITQPAPVATSALTAGELVIVQGTTNADGTVTATQVTANNAANPAGAPPTTAGA